VRIKVSYTAISTGSEGKRWYVWRQTKGGWRKTRLHTYLCRLQALGHHEQVAEVMHMAMLKGYR
jgi:hypothetical protein